jgi:hypothetical protein
MKRTKTIASILTALTLSCFMFAGIGHTGEWQDTHPRRAQVNHRLRHQNRRIDAGLRHGKLNAGEAAQLHSEDQSIRNQERVDAAANNGHITRGERHQLNHEENAESRQIHQDRHDGQ